MSRETLNPHQQWVRKHSCNFTRDTTSLYFSKFPVTNFALLSGEGGEVHAHGVRGMDDGSAFDRHTMCHEASVGKVRFAALAFLMHQEGIFDITAGAFDFLNQPFVIDFFRQKYPLEEYGYDVHKQLQKLFSSDEHRDSTKVRLVDLLSHTNGLGDVLFSDITIYANPKRTIEHPYFTLPESLKLPYQTDNDLPRSRGQFRDDITIPFNRGGYERTERKVEYAYSNVGYILFGDLLEAAYWHKTRTHKPYEQLLKDFTIQPIEGRAAGKIDFKETKFPHEFTATDNAAHMLWFDPVTEKIVDATRFNGHRSAVGIFSSADDAALLMQEFFRAFPGTAEYKAGLQNQNLFFTDETIALMKKEWERGIELRGTNMEKSAHLPSYMQPNPTHKYYTAPGFMVEIKGEGEKAEYIYHKSGMGWGLRRFVEFVAKDGRINQAIRLQENVTAMIAQEVGVSLEQIHTAYQHKTPAALKNPDLYHLHLNRERLYREYQERGAEYIKREVARAEQRRSQLPSAL